MSRPEKQGIDYFSLDTHMEDKIKLVEAKYGMEGYGLLIKLWQKIYSHGYYIKWKEEIQLLFSNEVNVDINRVNDVINSCLEWGIFNKNLYEQHNILTSHGIQLRYMKATARRKEVEIIGEYDLLKEKEKNNNVIIVDINGNEDNENKNLKSEGVNDNKNPKSPEVNADNSKQSKVKYSKVNTSSSNDNLRDSHSKNSGEQNQSLEHSDEEDKSEIPSAFHKAFNQMITPFQMQMLQSYIEDGIEEGAVILALKQAAAANANSLNYVKKVLDNWLERDIKTAEKAKQAIREFKARGNGPPGTSDINDTSTEEGLEKLYEQGYK